MREPWAKLRVRQIGGFAGDAALPPLIDLDRARQDPAGAQAFDQAAAALAAAGSSGRAEIGADIGGYRIELESAGGETHSFAVDGGSAQHTGGPDVAKILEPLLGLRSR